MKHATPRTLTISRDLKISRQFLDLRISFGKEISARLDTSDQKVIYYFERAFTRWMFNVAKAGINPFVERVTIADFVSKADLEYFKSRYPAYRTFDNFDWSWLETTLAKIYETDAIPLGVMSTVAKDNDVILSYIWPDGENVTYTMPIKTYEHAKELYVGPRGKHHEYILLVISRYDACGTTKNHCAVPKEVISFVGATTELFGSPINTCTKQYCSPFPDIEAYFGSLGSFFSPTFRLSTGIYMCNPPYDENIITDMTHRLLDGLRSGQEITIILVLPVWDLAGQKKIKPGYEGVKEFEALKLLTESGFVRSQMMLNFNDYQFYDYYLDKFTKVTDTHLMVLSNTNCGLQAVDIAQHWAQIVHN